MTSGKVFILAGKFPCPVSSKTGFFCRKDSVMKFAETEFLVQQMKAAMFQAFSESIHFSEIKGSSFIAN